MENSYSFPSSHCPSILYSNQHLLTTPVIGSTMSVFNKIKKKFN